MGKMSFLHDVIAETPEDGYNQLVAEAEFCYGNDPYSGSIATIESFDFKKKIAEKYTPSAYKKAVNYAEKDDFGDFYVAHCIDCGIVEWTRRSFKKRKPSDAGKAPVFRMRYAVVQREDGKVLHFYKTKTEADDKVLDMLRKSPGLWSEINVQYRPVKVSGDSETVTEFEMNLETFPNKPRRRKGSIIAPRHKYVFSGWGSC